MASIAEKCAVWDVHLQTYPDRYELSVTNKNGEALVKTLPRDVNDGDLTVALDALAWHAGEARTHRALVDMHDHKRTPLDWDG
jgi:hypothetical protein